MKKIDYTKLYNAIERLWDSEDPDCKEAEDYGFKDAIIQLLVDCYSTEDLFEWLIDNDFCPANNFRYADIIAKTDLDEDESWEDICNDALFSNDEFAVRSW